MKQEIIEIINDIEMQDGIGLDDIVIKLKTLLELAPAPTDEEIDKRLKQLLRSYGHNYYKTAHMDGQPYDEIDSKFMPLITELFRDSQPSERDKLDTLLKYSDKYQLSIQAWPNQTAVYISKDDVDLIDFGGDWDFAISKSIEYLDRITNKKEE